MHQQHHYYVLGKVGKALQKPSLTFIKWRLRGRQAGRRVSQPPTLQKRVVGNGLTKWFFKDPAGTYILSNNNNNKLDWLTVCIHNLCFEERATTEWKKKQKHNYTFFPDLCYNTTTTKPRLMGRKSRRWRWWWWWRRWRRSLRGGEGPTRNLKYTRKQRLALPPQEVEKNRWNQSSKKEKWKAEELMTRRTKSPLNGQKETIHWRLPLQESKLQWDTC